MDPLRDANVDVGRPPEQRTSADERALDAKLAAAAARTRLTVEQRRASGLSATVAEKVREIAAKPLTIIPRELPPDQLARVRPEEGDQPEIPATVKAAIVPPRFQGVTFDSYAPKTRGQEAALKAARFWTERAMKGECAMLALIGPQGTGKSHLLYAAANALLEKNRRCYARPWYRLADELRYGGDSPFVPGRAIEAHDVRGMLWKQKVVLLDEVRPTASTAFDDTELAKFACWAYDSKLAVFITSNVSPLADVMGPPAASRFTQYIIDGPDGRQV